MQIIPASQSCQLFPLQISESIGEHRVRGLQLRQEVLQAAVVLLWFRVWSPGCAVPRINTARCGSCHCCLVAEDQQGPQSVSSSARWKHHRGDKHGDTEQQQCYKVLQNVDSVTMLWCNSVTVLQCCHGVTVLWCHRGVTKCCQAPGSQTRGDRWSAC